MNRALAPRQTLLVVSHNYYYARTGTTDAVLKQRLLACDVRERIGLARGRVFRKRGGADGFPDVLWEIEFPDVAAHHTDMAVRAASAEFEAVRVGMRQLYRRFERPLFETNGADEGAVLSCMQLEILEAAAPPARVLRRLTEERELPLVMVQSWSADAGKVPASGALFERVD